MYIHKTASYTLPRFNDPAHYQQELKRYTDFYLRRTNKFIMLSLLGAHACMHKTDFPDDIPVYFATENGNLYDTEVVLNQIYRKKAFPKPINFINTMSNVAAFYVAQSLKISGRNIMVSSKSLSFERALELAQAEFLTGSAKTALVGSVDEAVFSDELFEKKIGLPTDRYKLVEASAWMYLTRDKSNSRAEIMAVQSCKDRQAVEEWLKEQSLDGDMLFSMGILIDDIERDQWRSILSGINEYDYFSDIGYNDSITAAGISSFIEAGAAEKLIHINKDYQGHYAVIVVSR